MTSHLPAETRDRCDASGTTLQGACVHHTTLWDLHWGSLPCLPAGMGTGSTTMWGSLRSTTGAVAGAAMGPTTGATATPEVLTRAAAIPHLLCTSIIDLCISFHLWAHPSCQKEFHGSTVTLIPHQLHALWHEAGGRPWGHGFWHPPWSCNSLQGSSMWCPQDGTPLACGMSHTQAACTCNLIRTP